MKVHSSRPSIARLGSELSAVINRVRRAFGPVSMRPMADLPQIRQAEEQVDQTARLLLRGEADLRTWYRMLRLYEDTWMGQLRQMRAEGEKRHAA